MIQSSLLAAARGERPADVLLKGGMVANVLTSELERLDVAVTDGRVVGLGTDYEGAHVVDVSGRFLLPGYLDAHVHIESSLATPAEFAKAVVPRGTTTVVCDPHEIANVHGLAGIDYILRSSEGLPLSVLVMASSCVPATPMGTAGAELTAGDLTSLLAHDRVLGLAEVMNFPGVIGGQPDVLAKIDAFAGRPVDGHAPGVRGTHLNAYIVGGPMSDHESTTPEEALEKLRRGLWLFLREATNAHNLRDLLPALTAENRRRVALCTDDRQPPDLLDEGGVDHMLRVLVESGIEPVEALRLATLNPAEYFGLRDRGAIAPGRRADIVVVSDLHSFQAEEVFVGGRPVARSGEALPWSLPPSPAPPRPSMRVAWDHVDLSIPARGEQVRVIRVIPDQIVTATVVTRPRVIDGMVAADAVRDLLKIAVIERHTGSGRVGLGLVHGMGLAEGALASTVAHDHHNIIVVGVDDRSMLCAARAVAREGGGLAVTRGDAVLATLPLPVGGLMSDRPMTAVRQGLEAVIESARGLGSSLHDPFMALSFLGLEVIPSLKITDRGLVDVNAFQLVDLWA